MNFDCSTPMLDFRLLNHLLMNTHYSTVICLLVQMVKLITRFIRKALEKNLILIIFLWTRTCIAVWLIIILSIPVSTCPIIFQLHVQSLFLNRPLSGIFNAVITIKVTVLIRFDGIKEIWLVITISRVPYSKTSVLRLSCCMIHVHVLILVDCMAIWYPRIMLI